MSVSRVVCDGWVFVSEVYVCVLSTVFSLRVDFVFFVGVVWGCYWVFFGSNVIRYGY